MPPWAMRAAKRKGAGHTPAPADMEGTFGAVHKQTSPCLWEMEGCSEAAPGQNKAFLYSSHTYI